MQEGIWQLFVRAVSSLLSLSVSSTEAPVQASPISSSDAQGSDANLTSTSRNTQDDAGCLRVTRNPKLETTDAFFGEMTYEGRHIAVTMERKAVSIPEGTYSGAKRGSQHFQMTVIGIDVPNRTNIECHPANWPCQLEGCIAVGESRDNDALDNSRTAFDAMMAAVPDSFTVVVTSTT